MPWKKDEDEYVTGYRETPPEAWRQLLINLANLFKVKTIITLGVIAVFCFKTLQGTELSNEFIMIASAVVTYYFTKREREDG